MFRLSRRRAIALGLLGIPGTLGLGGWIYYQWKYPYGYSHCCDKQLMFALLQYAEEHGGNYPAGEATPEASLSLLYPDYAGASLLCGKTVPTEVAQQILDRGERLGPDSCGWHYVEGLTRRHDRRLGLLWDKVAGLGHWGQRLSDGARNVLLVDGQFRYVPDAEWDAFLEEQAELLRRQRVGGHVCHAFAARLQRR
jgi:hypothetical protein